MIICNGIPKSGTHALIKAVQLMGGQTEHGHFPYAEKPNGVIVNIHRHPKNVLVSWLRFINRQITQGNLIWAMGAYEGGIYDGYARYEGYLSDTDVLCVSYEDLTASPECMIGMADKLDLKYLDDCWNILPGLTKTWTGKPSRWEDHWTDDVQEAWEKARGPEVERIWKY